VNRIFGALHQIKSNEHVVNDLSQLVPYLGETADQRNPPLKFRGSIELTNISFGFPGQPLLLHLANWKVKKKEKVAITGKSGKGKTSLLLLVLRMLAEKEGMFYLDGRKVSGLETPAWRSLFAYVPQNPYVLDATVEENIAFGVPATQIDTARVGQLLADMDLTNWIADLPEGTRTLIGEKGVKISGGQRQRLAIARALYQDKEILILDEVTNQLDPATESEIFEALQRASINKTIIMVTHHPDLLQKVDKVFEIVDQGIREVPKHQVHPAVE
jgi:ABC-type bacteriocin/lantibiotic exporter with double-glycine peptidase domain